jgi:hypothetical protein
MWGDVEGFVHARAAAWHATALAAVPDYGTITRTGGWGNDSSSAGFLFAPIDLYKEALARGAHEQDRQAGSEGEDPSAALASRVVETSMQWPRVAR